MGFSRKASFVPSRNFPAWRLVRRERTNHSDLLRCECGEAAKAHVFGIMLGFRLVVSKGCKPIVGIVLGSCKFPTTLARFVFLSRAIDETDSPSDTRGQATRNRVPPHAEYQLRLPPSFPAFQGKGTAAPGPMVWTGLDYLSSSRALTRAFKCRGWRAPSNSFFNYVD